MFDWNLRNTCCLANFYVARYYSCLCHCIVNEMLRNSFRSKRLIIVGSNRPDISTRYTPVYMYVTSEIWPKHQMDIGNFMILNNNNNINTFFVNTTENGVTQFPKIVKIAQWFEISITYIEFVCSYELPWNRSGEGGGRCTNIPRCTFCT